jgi:hypothetical protein
VFLLIKILFMFKGEMPEKIVREGRETLAANYKGGGAKEKKLFLADMVNVVVNGNVFENCTVIPLAGKKINGREVVLIHKSRGGDDWPKHFYVDSLVEEDGILTLTEEGPPPKREKQAA